MGGGGSGGAPTTPTIRTGTHLKKQQDVIKRTPRLYLPLRFTVTDPYLIQNTTILLYDAWKPSTQSGKTLSVEQHKGTTVQLHGSSSWMTQSFIYNQ
jgi:hypothetical protein